MRVAGARTAATRHRYDQDEVGQDWRGFVDPGSWRGWCPGSHSSQCVSGLGAVESTETLVLQAVRSAQEHTIHQVRSLEETVRSIIEASELTSTDDEHDPEGATIAYERAQAIALLRQAREDLIRLETARAVLDAGQTVVCAVCGAEIDAERIIALPTADRCIRCAR